ncbi:hypothetical protein ACG7TL_006667 [Trametes sanguinea]
MPPLPSAREASEILPPDAETALSLYSTLILPAERLAVERLEASGDKPNAPLSAPVVYARVVGYMLLYPLSDIARSTVTRDVASCNNLDKSNPIQALYELGETYTKHIITLCKVDDLSESAGLTQRLPNEMITITQCCHIFPDALGDISRTRAGSKEHAVASVWTFLDRFGYQDVCEELMGATAGANLHRLENILTLESNAHVLFDRLDLWFEAVEGQLHAACCRIAHMSGAADYVDLIFREMEEIGVLAEDGTTADVLTFALHRRLAEPV